MNDAQVEEVVIAAALHCSAAELAQANLSPADFTIYSARQIWGHLQRMELPSQVLLMDIDSALAVTAQQWVNRWGLAYGHPAGLRAHAALVKRYSEKRKAQGKHRDAILAIENGQAANAGVSLEYEEHG